MYQLPQLPFSYDALEPHIDAQTMKVHHQGHHRTYVEKLNKALEAHRDWQMLPLEELLARLNGVPDDIQTAVRNNGGGHYNHSLFWTLLTPEPQKAPPKELSSKIDGSFGGFDSFKEKFAKASAEHFSNGWTWLTVDRNGGLLLHSTPDHICPLTKGEFPLLVLDLWEHAYYLKHQNRRPEYIDAFWSVVNWREVDRRWNTFSNRQKNAA